MERVCYKRIVDKPDIQAPVTRGCAVRGHGEDGLLVGMERVYCERIVDKPDIKAPVTRGCLGEGVI